MTDRPSAGRGNSPGDPLRNRPPLTIPDHIADMAAQLQELTTRLDEIEQINQMLMNTIGPDSDLRRHLQLELKAALDATIELTGLLAATTTIQTTRTAGSLDRIHTALIHALANPILKEQ